MLIHTLLDDLLSLPTYPQTYSDDLSVLAINRDVGTCGDNNQMSAHSLWAMQADLCHHMRSSYGNMNIGR